MNLKPEQPLVSRLTRMSAFRQAAVMTMAFVAVALLAGTLAFFQLNYEFTANLERELHIRFAELQQEFETRQPRSEHYLETELEIVFLLPSGPRTSQLQSGIFDELEDSGLPVQPSKRDEHGDWVYLAGPVEGGHLIVGTNRGKQDFFEETTLNALALVGFLSILTAAALGFWFGARHQRRLSTITAMLGQVSEGNLSARIPVQQDKDDLDDLARRINDTVERLETSLRQSRDFSANIAHDLKTPLTRLRIRLETALAVATDQKNCSDEIGAALEQSDKIIAIFNAFLQIAKLESGAARAHFTEVDLALLTEEIITTYGPVVQDSNRQLIADISGPTKIQGDRVLLIQMLANMIENALRHTPEKTAIRLIVRPNELGLADNGPGIPKNLREKVLQPLYRLDKSRTTEGVGLGLSLIKTIAELHGAELLLSEDPRTGQGLYVRALFPENPQG
ncbi:ATP-binding protein [Rhodovibrionaceae bacterium A322]